MTNDVLTKQAEGAENGPIYSVLIFLIILQYGPIGGKNFSLNWAHRYVIMIKITRWKITQEFLPSSRRSSSDLE